jgi:hypothetical protein
MSKLSTCDMLCHSSMCDILCHSSMCDMLRHSSIRIQCAEIQVAKKSSSLFQTSLACYAASIHKMSVQIAYLFNLGNFKW